MDAETKKYVEWIAAHLDKRTGKSKAALARHLNLAHPQITRLLQGKRRLKVDEIPRIAEFLGVPPPMTEDDPSMQELAQLYLEATPEVRRMVLDILKLGRPQSTES